MILFLFSIFVALPALGASFPALERSTSTAPISMIYPAEKTVLPLTEGEFVLGSVSEPKARFEINGQTVAVHSNGAFLAWLPIAPGTFTFTCALDLKDGATTYRRTVFVTPPPAALPEKPLAIDKDSLWPQADLELRPGDWLLARMKATPGQKAQFRLRGRPWRPMREANSALGIYEGAYLVAPGEEQAGPVEFLLGSGWGAVKAATQARVALTSQSPPIAVVKGEGPVPMRAGPGEGDDLFPAYGGTRFVTAGRQGTETKVRLSAALSGWIETKNLDFLPPGTQPPRALTDAVTTKASEDGTVVRISLTERVPFQIEEDGDPGSLTVRLYDALAHTNWIVYHSADSLVSELRVRQESSDSVAVTVRLRPGLSLWGTRASFEGSSLKIELRRPPRLAEAPASPLSGRIVFLDPGHNPSQTGATGPLGTREMDVNFAIAKAAEGLLLKEGAVPVLSRNTNEDEVPLAERPRLAWEKKADLFVSIHNNNPAPGKNPFLRPHGYSIFYYHPHSLALAREIHRSYQKTLGLPDEELRFGDLLVLRATEMPSVLTESAYMTFPEQEEMLLDPKFQQTVAQTIVEGLRSYLEKERTRQAPEPEASKKKTEAKEEPFRKTPHPRKKARKGDPA